MNTLLVIHILTYVYSFYHKSITHLHHKYDELKAWTLDGRVFYKARMCGADRQSFLIYSYDSYVYVFLLAILKMLDLSELFFLETPDNIILDANSINIYAYYSANKMCGEILYGPRVAKLRRPRARASILYVMIDNSMNMTREYEMFRPSIDGALMTASELMVLLWLFKNRQRTATPPQMRSISIIFDKNFKEQVFKSDDIILLEDE